MQSEIAESSVAGRLKASSDRDLVSAAAPIFEAILQIRAGLLTPTTELRRLIDNWFGEMEQRAQALGYQERQVRDARFALTAFIDETVLSRSGPWREGWERNPLQLEYFREAHAGVQYFDRLDGLLKNAEAEADVIEVYYLCLLLGFKGKYHIFMEDQLPGVINNVAENLRRVGRLRGGVLSPHWKATDQPEPPAADPGLPRWVKIGAAAAIGGLSLVYLLLNFLLASSLNGVKQVLLK